MTVASGMPQHRDQTAITIAQKNAALHAARIAAGDSVELPAAQFVHLFVTRGAITVEAVGELTEGDALRLTDIGAVRVIAIRDAEILVWEMHTRLGG
ncbi:putative quercetin 2,3-dioxygenase [Mycobacteroides abscessus subsp. abscessus]|nr:putative quercetin 2,3-dioxygenase [Mycobacteroides abscessus subsp. abscessus]